MQYLDGPNQTDLVRRLRSLTENKRIRWEQPYVDDDFIFGVTIGRSTYLLASKDRDDLHPFVLSVYLQRNEEVKEIQEISSEPDTGELNQHLSALYSDVKRAVLGVDEVVRDLFADLDGLDSSEG